MPSKLYCHKRTNSASSFTGGRFSLPPSFLGKLLLQTFWQINEISFFRPLGKFPVRISHPIYIRSKDMTSIYFYYLCIMFGILLLWTIFHFHKVPAYLFLPLVSVHPCLPPTRFAVKLCEGWKHFNVITHSCFLNVIRNQAVSVDNGWKNIWLKLIQTFRMIFVLRVCANAITGHVEEKRSEKLYSDESEIFWEKSGFFFWKISISLWQCGGRT